MTSSRADRGGAEPSAGPPPAFPPPVGRGRTSPDYISTLDGWRALAILVVMAHHGEVDLFGGRGLVPNPALLHMAEAGRIGVDVFFGISGFLICDRLLREREARGRIDLRGFYTRRGFRILPAYLAFLGGLGLLTFADYLWITEEDFLSCLFFVRNYHRESQFDWFYTFHCWSLSVEEHFYAIWPGLLILAADRRRARWVALGLGLAVAIWREVDEGFRVVEGLTGSDAVGSYQRTDTRLAGLLFGCWVALIVAEPGWRERLARWLAPPAWGVLAAAFAAVVFVPIRFPLRNFWISAAIPFLLVGTTLHPGSAAGRVLEWGPLRWVGRLSYSLYLWQQLFLKHPPFGAAPLGRLQRMPLEWAATFACAIASYYLIERPAIARGRSILARRAGPTPARRPA